MGPDVICLETARREHTKFWSKVGGTQRNTLCAKQKTPIANAQENDNKASE
jgi:hypothetical protein